MGSFQDIISNSKLLDKENGYHKLSPFFVPKILVNLASGQISMKYGFMVFLYLYLLIRDRMIAVLQHVLLVFIQFAMDLES